MAEINSLGRGARTTRVAEIMSSPVSTVAPDSTVRSVAALLSKSDISGAPVVDKHNRPIGIVTLKDLVREQAAWEDGLSPTVSEIMTRHVITVTSGASIGYAGSLMARERIHRVPVVSGSGRVVGIVSSWDIVRWLARHQGYVP